MNKNLLKSVIAKSGDTFSSLAEKLGISKATLSKKVNEKSNGFTQPEIVKIKEIYDLSAEDIDSIFFEIKVS